jgi:hypothetical protein
VCVLRSCPVSPNIDIRHGTGRWDTPLVSPKSLRNLNNADRAWERRCQRVACRSGLGKHKGVRLMTQSRYQKDVEDIDDNFRVALPPKPSLCKPRYLVTNQRRLSFPRRPLQSFVGPLQSVFTLSRPFISPPAQAGSLLLRHKQTTFGFSSISSPDVLIITVSIFKNIPHSRLRSQQLKNSNISSRHGQS